MHVLIIGGGIGGLCLAQGLRRRGVSVAVYERDRTPDARLQGYRLSIEPPGSGTSPLATALRDYQAEMLDRGFKTVRGVRLYTRMAISRSRLLRTTARAFFRLCGAVGPLRRAAFSD
jgi:2-polyprenyl-6-methoxyphenol hydroxylase-like FAD-dependent oxidoreductase